MRHPRGMPESRTSFEPCKTQRAQPSIVLYSQLISPARTTLFFGIIRFARKLFVVYEAAIVLIELQTIHFSALGYTINKAEK